MRPVPITRRLIKVHLAEGNQSEAVREFARYQTLLRVELGLEPTPRLRHLIDGSPVVPTEPPAARRQALIGIKATINSPGKLVRDERPYADVAAGRGPRRQRGPRPAGRGQRERP
jgi:transcriptional activator